MSIWDKGEKLGGERLDGLVEAGQPFILYAMDYKGEVDLENGMPPAKKTVLLIREASRDPEQGWVGMKEGPVAAGTLASPIAEMAVEASADDFPVVACWKRVKTKAGNDATVLEMLTRSDKIAEEFRTIDPADTPDDWNPND